MEWKITFLHENLCGKKKKKSKVQDRPASTAAEGTASRAARDSCPRDNLGRAELHLSGLNYQLFSFITIMPRTHSLHPQPFSTDSSDVIRLRTTLPPVPG